VDSYLLLGQPTECLLWTWSCDKNTARMYEASTMWWNLKTKDICWS